MNQKEYELYDGRTITFCFDDGKVGYITLHAMDALVGEIQELAAERDAAVKDIPRNCPSCKYSYLNNQDMEGICKYTEVCDIHWSKWEWRGVQDVV